MVNLRQAADEGPGAELAAARSSRGQSIMAVGEGNAKASGGDGARARGAVLEAREGMEGGRARAKGIGEEKVEGRPSSVSTASSDRKSVV